MELSKLAPWNWFKKEDEEKRIPVRTADRTSYPALDRVYREFDRLMNSFFEDFGLPGRMQPLLGEAGAFIAPKVDIHGGDERYTVTLEVPGIDVKDIRLEVQGDTLTIQAEKKREEESKQSDCYIVERSFGHFRRRLSLPDDADADGISAKLKNGVLTVTIPRVKKPGSAPKRISVTAD